MTDRETQGPAGNPDSPNIGMVNAGLTALRLTGMASQKRGDKGREADEQTVIAVWRAMIRAGIASAIEAASAGETRRGSTEGESAVPKGDAQ